MNVHRACHNPALRLSLGAAMSRATDLLDTASSHLKVVATIIEIPLGRGTVLHKRGKFVAI
jgi:hypothetical protein